MSDHKMAQSKTLSRKQSITKQLTTKHLIISISNKTIKAMMCCALYFCKKDRLSPRVRTLGVHLCGRVCGQASLSVVEIRNLREPLPTFVNPSRRFHIPYFWTFPWYALTPKCESKCQWFMSNYI